MASIIRGHRKKAGLTQKELADLAGLGKTVIFDIEKGKDNSLTYFVKRFDRTGRHKKMAVEDFAQLSGASRETKYKSSMEKVVKILDRFCTFPAVEKVKLFELTLFNFLVGNEDMHLKNFSLIRNEDKKEKYISLLSSRKSRIFEP